jgi:serpin B
MKKFLLLLLPCLLLISCGQGDNVEEPLPIGTLPERVKTERLDIPLSANELNMAKVQDQFAIDLFKQQESAATEPNMAISPLSVAYALAMVSNGAAGTTLDEIKATLGFGDYALNDMNVFYAKLTEGLTTVDGETILGIANSIWLNQGNEFKPAFIEVNQSKYEAEVSTLDFATPDAVSIINDWVSEKTYGYIPHLLDELNPNDALNLVNTIYFDGLWEWTPVRKPKTKKGTFTNQDGSVSEVEVISLGEYSAYYYAAEGVAMAELPYGNGAYSMVVLLPTDDATQKTMLAGLTGNRWKEWMQSTHHQLLNITFPTFEIKHKTKLGGTLQALGIKEAFDVSKAQLPAVIPPKPTDNPYIRDVMQEVVIKVNEYGTTAAAATYIPMAGFPGETELPIPIDFHVDKPFLFAIKENSTGTILFMGKVSELPAD